MAVRLPSGLTLAGCIDAMRKLYEEGYTVHTSYAESGVIQTVEGITVDGAPYKAPAQARSVVFTIKFTERLQ